MKRQFNIQTFFVFIFFLFGIFLLLSSPVFLRTEAAGQDTQNMVHLGLVGQGTNDYGEFNAVEIWKHEEAQECKIVEVTYACCATSKGVVIIDVARRSVVSFIPLGRCEDLEIARANSGGSLYAYVAGWKWPFNIYVAVWVGKFYIINLDDPNKPYYMAQCDTPGYAGDVAVEGDYAFVVGTSSGLQIIDVSNKSEPKIVASCDTPYYVEDVAIKGDYAYVADRGSGLQIIDISNKSGPKIVGYCDTPGSAEAVTIEGDYAYVAAGGSGLQIIDINSKSGPKIAASWYRPCYAENVAIKGDYAYVIDRGSGLQIIDISSKSGPKVIGTCYTPGYIQSCYNLGYPQDMAIDGDYAYVAYEYYGLQIIDISSKSGPKVIGSCYTPGNTYAITIEGDYAYVADGRSGLQIIDVSNKSEPKVLGSCDTPSYAGDVAIEGGYAYVADGGSGLQIIDVSNKSEPKIVASCDTPGEAGGVAIEGDYAFVVGTSSGLQIIDVSNKSEPKIVASCDTPYYVEDVAIKGDYAYVVDFYTGLQVIDIGNKSEPKVVGSYDTPYSAEDMAIDGDYLYVADGPGGLLILKITIGPSPKGNLILVAGGGAHSENTLWPPTQAQANQIMATFINYGYEVYDIWYQNPISFQDIDYDGTMDQLIVDDATPTKAEFQVAITHGAIETPNTGPLYLYLSGLGTQDSFQIMPGEILKASDPLDPNNPDTLKYALDSFQEGTGRDVICLLEFSSSGSFCDDLIDSNTPAYSRTIITCTDDESSSLNQSGNLAFTGQFISLLQTLSQIGSSGLFSDTGLSRRERISLLQEVFSQARELFHDANQVYSFVFRTQPPQMVTAKGPDTLCSISLSCDPSLSYGSYAQGSNQLVIADEDQTISLMATGHYAHGLDKHIEVGQIFYHSSDESILQVTQSGEVRANPDTHYNGKVYILATIIDPDFTQSPDRDPSLPSLGGVTGRIAVTVNIPGRTEKENHLAIIVAGEKEEQDSLWPEIHTVTHYAYRTLLGRGYSRERIIYLTHLKNELSRDDDPANDHVTDLDGDGDPNNDIDGIPSLTSFKEALEWVAEKGTDHLTLFLANHGIEKESSLSSSGGFYLTSPANDPESILTPETLDFWLDELQAQLPDLKITLIIESCHSGLFIEPLSGEGRIILTSTREGESYLYAHGLVSFSYYLFTYLQSGANMARAFDSASQSILKINNFLYLNRQFLNEPQQRPQLENRDLAKSFSLGGSFLISQDQPVVISSTISPDPNAISIGEEITVQVRASDLDGIEKVWALINATYSPPVFSGDIDRTVIDLPKIDLSLTGNGVYEGRHPGLSYAGPYSFLIFAQDKKGTISLPYTVFFNVTGDEQNRAILIKGYAPGFDVNPLLSHAQWVLSEKRFNQVKTLTTPSLLELEQEIKDVSAGANQLLIYFIGQTITQGTEGVQGALPGGKPLFLIDQNVALDPDTFNQWLDGLDCTVIFLLDAPLNLSPPFENTFLDPGPGRINITGSLTGTPYWDQGGHCAFSHFFFTCLYWGANVYQAYQHSIHAIDYYSYQKPFLYDGAYGELAKATYLGSPFLIETAGPRISVPADQTVQGYVTLWAEVNVSDPTVWCLIKTPHKGIVNKALLPSEQGRYETTWFFDYPGLYEVITYVQDDHGLIDYDVTKYTKNGSYGDNYEVDDSPQQATPILINDTKFPQVHNFHDPNDVDWVVFYAHAGYPEKPSWKGYEVWVEKIDNWMYCSLKAALYTLEGDRVLGPDQLPFVLDFSDNEMDRIYPGLLPKAGYYFLKFYYDYSFFYADSSHIPLGAGTTYKIKKITDNLVGSTGLICGHVRHSEYNTGIPGATIRAEKKPSGGSYVIESLSGNDGAFWLFDLWQGEYYLSAQVPGYQESPKVLVKVEANSKKNLTLYLSLPVNHIKADVQLGFISQYSTLVPQVYIDWKKEHLITLQPGFNLISLPCHSLDGNSQEFNSQDFLGRAYDGVNTFYQEKGLPFDFLMAIQRLHEGDWQVCFKDNSQAIQGDTFSLDPHEGYCVYFGLQDQTQSMKSLFVPITCDPNALDDEGYELGIGMNLLGFHQPSSESATSFFGEDFWESEDLKDKISSIFHYLPQKGTFFPHYQLFGKPAGFPCQLDGEKGNIIFMKEGVND